MGTVVEVEADLLDDLDDLADEDMAPDDEADRLLEDMRRLNRDVAAAVNSIDGCTESASAASDKMHSRLTASVLDIISDVAAGVSEHEKDSEAHASSDAISLPLEDRWQPVVAAVPESVPSPAATRGDTASAASNSPARPAGRFKMPPPQQQPEAKSVVSDISRLASKPLLDDSQPLPSRRPGARGGRGAGVGARAAPRGGGG